MSSGEFEIVWREQAGVDLPGDIALEAADDLFLAQALRGALLRVGPGAGPQRSRQSTIRWIAALA
jgi:hypothetical protein